MRAIIVSAGFADVLAITLPYNSHHFSEVWIVTTPNSEDGKTAREHGAHVFETDAFTDDGAIFNKWKAMEQCLTAMGRRGWMCHLDVDILWPKSVGVVEQLDGSLLIYKTNEAPTLVLPDQLCSPLRRMWDSWPDLTVGIMGNKTTIRGMLPTEDAWSKFPIHNNVTEWAGYSQIFWADSLHLKFCGNCGLHQEIHPHPACRHGFAWHDTTWVHGGGSDSFFQKRWPKGKKVRPPFECLHLGSAGVNWHGRVTPYTDGKIPEGAEERAAKTRDLWKERRISGFTKEKLP